MYLAHLSLADFRSYEAAEVPLEPGVTTLVGENGQGKTNLVEAVGYLATLSSHRVAADAALVRQGCDSAVVRAAVVHEERRLLVELQIKASGANRARLNRAPLTRARDVLGAVRSVLFAPEDLALVKGDPDGRRRFLDELLVALTPRFAAVRATLDRVLKQRNALLRGAAAGLRAGRPGDAETLEIWNAQLAAVGAELVAARLSLVTRLAPLLAAGYGEVSAGRGEVVLDYRSALGELPADPPGREELQQAYLDAMARLRRPEIERGVSLVGPQRDDLAIGLGGMPAKGYASHGESWSLALALRLASYELLRADSGTGDPILILDDVFAELDAGRRERLATLVSKAEQVLVTAAVPEDLPEPLDGARFHVTRGQVSRVG